MFRSLTSLFRRKSYPSNKIAMKRCALRDAFTEESVNTFIRKCGTSGQAPHEIFLSWIYTTGFANKYPYPLRIVFKNQAPQLTTVFNKVYKHKNFLGVVMPREMARDRKVLEANRVHTDCSIFLKSDGQLVVPHRIPHLDDLLWQTSSADFKEISQFAGFVSDTLTDTKDDTQILNSVLGIYSITSFLEKCLRGNGTEFAAWAWSIFRGYTPYSDFRENFEEITASLELRDLFLVIVAQRESSTKYLPPGAESPTDECDISGNEEHLLEFSNSFDEGSAIRMKLAAKITGTYTNLSHLKKFWARCEEQYKSSESWKMPDMFPTWLYRYHDNDSYEHFISTQIERAFNSEFLSLVNAFYPEMAREIVTQKVISLPLDAGNEHCNIFYEIGDRERKLDAVCATHDETNGSTLIERSTK